MTILYETHRLTFPELRDKRSLAHLRKYISDLIDSDDFNGVDESVIIKINVILSEAFPGIQICTFKEQNSLIIDFIFREPEQKTLFYLLYN